MATFKIGPLGPSDAEAYWAVRLEALDIEPLAFGSAAEEHRAEGFEAVTARNLGEVPHGNSMLGAFADGRLVGIAGLFRSDRVKERHLAGVVSMFVTPDARGQGLGRSLLTALIERARGYDGLERLGLSVPTHATAARALYRAMGFVPHGVEPQALKVGEAYADKETMSLALREQSA